MQRISRVISLISIILIIFMSKTVYFGMLNQNITNIAFLIVSIISIVLCKNLNRENIIVALILSLLLNITIILNFSIIDNVFFLNIRGVILLLISVLFITSSISKKEFIIYYINIIYVYCIISIICFVIAILLPQYVDKIAKDFWVGGTLFKLSPFYTWGLDGIFTRNAGPFWEPGAFQAFINVAILLSIFYKEDIKKYKIKIIILSITLLTTQSTTGYIIFLIIIFVFGTDVIKNVKVDKVTKFLLSSIIIISALLILQSNNIDNKLNENNKSTAIRLSDYKQSLKMISEKPIGGYGLGFDKNAREIELNIINNSNGLLSMIYTYGLIFSIYYIYRLLKGLAYIFPTKNILKKYTIIVIFTMIHSTEGLVFLPLYLTFLFKWKEN